MCCTSCTEVYSSHWWMLIKLKSLMICYSITNMHVMLPCAALLSIILVFWLFHLIHLISLTNVTACLLHAKKKKNNMALLLAHWDCIFMWAFK